ncbi:amidohydrolase family protein [Paraburkholderia sp. BL10I2N1]|uniref:amidohydrolase family protein n=1 Tax=Paraburkholderia sp. BL10I2N1 TaxID=1938796 RepID=UPI001060FD1A|nr:amidohydrolase family protein [Paraburkholderia sp. BL10I2N1]TDN61429.1 putative TIM-barrel fold metal-dependent hydrolase [Paraburkholderia sp. BL10I2N1]
MTQASPIARPWSPRVDTHAHVFSRTLPLANERRYAPDYDATLDAYRKLLDGNEIGNAVLVQPSFLGTDNSYLLQALARDRTRLRGVAVVSPDISEDDLVRLNDRGITGVRLNLVGQALPDISAAPYMTLWQRLSNLGWHVELHREASDLAPLIHSLLDVGLPVVVDHFGRPDPDSGTGDQGFKTLLDLGPSGRVWVKISGAYRCAKPGSDFMRDATNQLINAFGAERLMWGSDWPHTQFEDAVDYGQTLSAFLDLHLAPSHVDAILCSTPHSFYGFDKDPASDIVPTTPISQLTS